MPIKWTSGSFQGLLEAAPDAFVVVDAQGRIVLVNSQTEALFGYHRDELVGTFIEQLIPQRYHQQHQHDRTRYMDHPQRRPMGIGRNLLARRKDGTEFYAEISLSPFPAADQTYVTAVVRDISERIEAAEKLERLVQERTAHLNMLLQYSRDLLTARNIDDMLKLALIHAATALGSVEHGQAYVCDQISRAFDVRAQYKVDHSQESAVDEQLVARALSEKQAFQIVDRTQFPAWVPADTTGIIVQPCQTPDTVLAVLVLVQYASFELQTTDWHTLEGIANLTAAALEQVYQRQEASSLSSLVSTLQAQHEHMAERLTTAEAAMLQSARLAAMGQLAASIAHEINNPLYAVRNSLELLEDDLPEELKESVYLGLARDQLARIARIIERMRNFYRPPRGEFAAVDLNTLLQETLDLAELHERSGSLVKIHFQPMTDLPPIYGMGDQLRQVFLNLVLNAIQAMPQGGVLDVQTFTQDSTVIVRIRDTGTGISEEERAKIFEPFFTTKANGTGLGLAISAHIIQHHQGTIELHPNQPQGTTVLVALPSYIK